MVVISWVVTGSVCVGFPLQCGYGGVVSLCSQTADDGVIVTSKHVRAVLMLILILFFNDSLFAYG